MTKSNALLVALMSASLLSCDTGVTESNPESALSKPYASGFMAATESGDIVTVHDRYMALNMYVPSFAGIYLDKSQTPHIMLKNGDRDDANIILEEMSKINHDGIHYASTLAARDINELKSSVIIESANYTYMELSDVLANAYDVINSSTGILRASIDVIHNSVTVEYSETATLNSVQAAFESCG